MPNFSVALVLTSAEARALFDAAALGLRKRAESGMAGNDKVVDALQKIQQQMELVFKIKTPVSGRGAAGVKTCMHFGEPAVPDLD
jgi:hypothetical protein